MSPFLTLLAVFGIYNLLNNEEKPCDNDWINYSDSEYCYKVFSEESVDFRLANSSCVTQNANLVSIQSQKENDFVVEISQVNSKSLSVIIGLIIGSDRSIHWTDRSIPKFLNWATNQPGFADTSPLTTTHAVLINNRLSSKLEYGKWYDYPLDRPIGSYSYICKKPKRNGDYKAQELTGSPAAAPPQIIPLNIEPLDYPENLVVNHKNSECHAGWIPLFGNSVCYKIFNPKTWAQAAEACHSEGAYLASVLSTEVNSFLIDIAKSTYDTNATCNFWIGINIYPDGQSWRNATWDDGSSLEYINWAPEEPNNPENQKCGLLIVDPSNIYSNETSENWISADCNTENAFVCEKSPSSVSSELASVTPSASAIRGHRYYINLTGSIIETAL